MESKPRVSIFWFRRDLRLEDNHGLFEALKNHKNVLPIFIFDFTILSKLGSPYDARVTFIYAQIERLHKELASIGSTIHVLYDFPLRAFSQLTNQYEIEAVYTNNDYEPYARKRDKEVEDYLQSIHVPFHSYKDQVIFEKNEVVKDSGDPYTVFTPYSKKWLSTFTLDACEEFKSTSYPSHFYKCSPSTLPQLVEMGFHKTETAFPDKTIPKEIITSYHLTRDIPSIKGTSRLSVHLRFGTVSIRHLTKIAAQTNATWLNELIWRNFYMTILWFYPNSVHSAFKPEYDRMPWNNKEEEFEAWCTGNTGYPIVDAGMRELNETGFMHNRVRMIVSSFLVKHLLIDWRWGEAYFAEKLLDYDQASNVGGWQWAASSGCDAAPYFRIFNPTLQTQKFDPQLTYIKRWVPEFQSFSYPKPIVDHTYARNRVLEAFKIALGK